MRYCIEYYITEWRYILREFSDEQAFNDAKTAFYSQKGKCIGWVENAVSEGQNAKEIMIPMDKVMLIRSYSDA